MEALGASGLGLRVSNFKVKELLEGLEFICSRGYLRVYRGLSSESGI